MSLFRENNDELDIANILHNYLSVLEADDGDDGDGEITIPTPDNNTDEDSDEESNDGDEESDDDESDTSDEDDDEIVIDTRMTQTTDGDDSSGDEGGEDVGDSGDSDEASNDSDGEDASDSDDDSEADTDDDKFIDLLSMEKELYKNLSPFEIATRNQELREGYLNLYDFILDYSDKLNRVKKTNINVKALEYCEKKVWELKEITYHHITKNFANSTYIENQIKYKQILQLIYKIILLIEKISYDKEKR